MENSIKNKLLRPTQKPHDLQQAIYDVCDLMEAVQQRFEIESDEDMIEAHIYEMESLRARYRYLLKQARQEGITAVGVPLWGDAL